MKIRNGFVSNSSASSFVCDVCGTRETGWDHQYSINVSSCINGHEFCGEHKLDVELTEEEEQEINESCDGGCHPKECPLCMMDAWHSADLLNYVIKKYNLDKETIKKEIKNKFNDLNELYEYLRK